MKLRVIWKDNGQPTIVEFKQLTFIKGIMSVISVDNKLHTFDMEEVQEFEMREKTDED